MREALLAALAVAIVLITFTAGVIVGKETKPVVMDVKLPDTITISGIPSERADCLQWVFDNMKDPNSGVAAIMCNGAKD
jgi:hypothetical protein